MLVTIHLRDFWCICKFLTVDTVFLLANTRPTRLLLFPIIQYQKGQLSWISERLKCLLLHIIPHKLQWLPMSYYIVFKHVKAIIFSQSLIYHVWLNPVVWLVGIDYQFPLSFHDQPQAGMVLPWLQHRNGTDSNLMCDPSKPFIALEANSRLTCLDYHTHYHSLPPLEGAYWITTLLAFRTIPFWIPEHLKILINFML